MGSSPPQGSWTEPALAPPARFPCNQGRDRRGGAGTWRMAPPRVRRANAHQTASNCIKPLFEPNCDGRARPRAARSCAAPTRGPAFDACVLGSGVSTGVPLMQHVLQGFCPPPTPPQPVPQKSDGKAGTQGVRLQCRLIECQSMVNGPRLKECAVQRELAPAIHARRLRTARLDSRLERAAKFEILIIILLDFTHFGMVPYNNSHK